MTLFKKNKIFLDSETAAEQLRRARQAKKLKLKNVAKKLNINYQYLKALEREEYEKLPAGVYGKNFLRQYALFLGLNYDKLLKDYSAERKSSQAQEQKKLFSRQIIKNHYFWIAPKIFKNILIGIVVIACLFYLGFRLNKIVSPPFLYINNPTENFITKEHSLNVSGKTEPEALVVINGESILSNINGDFSKTINLKSGINIITIAACKKYGRDKIIIRQILVEEE